MKPTFKLPKGVKFLQVPIYDTPILFIPSYKAYEQVANLLGDYIDPAQHLAGVVTGVSHNDYNGLICGVFDGSINTLVHECGHLAFAVMDNTGIPVDCVEHQEAYCYLLGYIADELHKFMVK